MTKQINARQVDEIPDEKKGFAWVFDNVWNNFDGYKTKIGLTLGFFATYFYSLEYAWGKLIEGFQFPIWMQMFYVWLGVTSVALTGGGGLHKMYKYQKPLETDQEKSQK